MYQHDHRWLAAKPHKTQRRAVRVIGCNGAGSLLDVVKALEWVHSNLQAPAIVLMSLGSPVAAILDAAAQSLIDIGITVVVAGGNSAGGWRLQFPYACCSATVCLIAMLMAYSMHGPQNGLHEPHVMCCTADACNDSPARQPSVIAVGAVALGDGMASFSNGGSCIDILAPGVNIISAAPGSPTATA